MTMEKDFLIPASLAQAIADYLSQKPYREVAGLLAALANLKTNEPSSDKNVARTPKQVA